LTIVALGISFDADVPKPTNIIIVPMNAAAVIRLFRGRVCSESSVALYRGVAAHMFPMTRVYAAFLSAPT